MQTFNLISEMSWFGFVTLGPDLPVELWLHSMVPLGLGQAILGGMNENNNYQKKIYFMTCSNRNCIISTLTNELSHPISDFVAIPISDVMAGCISEGKIYNFTLTGVIFTSQQSCRGLRSTSAGGRIEKVRFFLEVLESLIFGCLNWSNRSWYI